MQTRSASLRDSNLRFTIANNKRARDEPPLSDDIVRAVVERTKTHCMWLPLGETEGFDSIKPSAAINLPIRDPWPCSAIKARREAATRYVDLWAKESNEFSSLFLFGSETHFGGEDTHEEIRALTAPLIEEYKEDPALLRDAGIALLQAAELTNAAVLPVPSFKVEKECALCTNCPVHHLPPTNTYLCRVSGESVQKSTKEPTTP